MEILRTPDEMFIDLPGYHFDPHYIQIGYQSPESRGRYILQLHYLDEGPPAAAPVLMIHGEPSWCYLYRKMIPILTAAGHRAVAPDLIGFGRSDKLTRRGDYTYQFHVDTMTTLVEELDLNDITLVCQDWGGLIGLRVAAENPHRFKRIVAANTGLPTGDHPMTEGFMRWRHYSQTVENFHAGGIVKGGCVNDLPPEVIAAYNAPFPDDSYKAGARQFPLLVPISPDDPAAEANRRAWEVLCRWDKPFLTAFSDSDTVTRGGEKVFQKLVPGAKDQPHVTIRDAGHFLQEDKGEELAQIIVDFIARTP